MTGSFDISHGQTCGSCQSTIGKYASIKAPEMGKGQCNPINILHVCIFIWKFSNSTGRNVLGRWVEDFGLVLCGEKEAEEWPHCSLQLPEEGRGEGSSWSLLAGIQWEDLWECFKAAPGISDWTLGNISLWRGWSNTEAGFLKRWWMPQAFVYNALNNILTFGHPWIGQAAGLEDCCRSPSNWKSSMLCSALLCYPIEP